MTRTTNARIAGFTFLFYIAAGVVSMILFGRATGGEGTAANAIGAFLFKIQSWNPIIAATFFAVGSTLFSWLLLRGGMVPLALASLGVVASVLLVVVLPLQLAGFLGGPITLLVWLPMLVFEVTLALWMIIRGVGIPGRMQSA